MGNELSSREKAVLKWLLKGFSNKEIGQTLGISPRTVQKHLQRVYRHLSVGTRAEAIVLAHKQQIETGGMGSENYRR
jgi:DNA-binding NarL/FixJ family response regulator